MPNNAAKMYELEGDNLPPLLKEIADPPKRLRVLGKMPDDGFNLCVVGSRKPTPYGKQAVESLIKGLAGHPINIVSGLAIGTDTLAHESALSNSLTTLAVPGSGLDKNVLYPACNRDLARRIIEKGGAIVSEFDDDFRATPWSFPQRNRIMAGLSDAVLIIEAEVRSGTLITARLATEYNRDVFAVPGSIFSSNSKGTNMFIKLGATPVCSSEDILIHFGLEAEKRCIVDLDDLAPDELVVWNRLKTPASRAELLSIEEISIERATIALSMLEIRGYIKESMGLITRII